MFVLTDCTLKCINDYDNCYDNGYDNGYDNNDDDDALAL